MKLLTKKFLTKFPSEAVVLKNCLSKIQDLQVLWNGGQNQILDFISKTSVLTKLLLMKKNVPHNVWTGIEICEEMSLSQTSTISKNWQNLVRLEISACWTPKTAKQKPFIQWSWLTFSRGGPANPSFWSLAPSLTPRTWWDREGSEKLTLIGEREEHTYIHTHTYIGI